MSDSLSSWPRPHYRKPGGRPFLFFLIYGEFPSIPSLDLRAYRTRGIPSGLELSRYSRSKHPNVFLGFEQGYLWNELLSQDPDLAAQVSDAGQCLILHGELDDRDNLDYLRDSIGLITFLLDHGGTCVYDPQMFRWWAPEPWRRTVFEPDAVDSRRHVIILHSHEESDAGDESPVWYHTRGLRKFGRPDLSVHDVPQHYRSAVVDLLGRFIELQALGGVIEEGFEVRMESLPAGMTCHHAGHLDDPDFNNVHIEITPPKERRLSRAPSLN